MDGWRTRIAQTETSGHLTLRYYPSGAVSIDGDPGLIFALPHDVLQKWEQGHLAPGSWFSTTGNFGWSLAVDAPMIEYDIIGADPNGFQWICIRR